MNMVEYWGFVMRDYFCLPYQDSKIPTTALTQNQTRLNSLLLTASGLRKIILSMIPAVIIGLFFEDFIASLFNGKIALVGAMLMITAILLFLADRVP